MNQIQKRNEYSLQDMKEASKSIAESGLFQQWDTPGKVLSLMLVCKAEGSDPMSAVQRYDNINQNVSKKPIAMLDDFIADGGKVKWVKTDEKVAKAVFISPNGIEQEWEYTWKDAVRAGNTSKANYKKYPAEMLRARCISSCLRAIYPKSTSLTYTPDEAEDIQSFETETFNITEESQMFDSDEEKEIKVIKGENVEWTDEQIYEYIEKHALGYLKDIGWIETSLDDLTDAKFEKIKDKFVQFTEKVEKSERGIK